MNKKDFFSRQISLSEWFEKIDFKNKKEFRKEDNEKRERLQVLQDELGLPFDKPTKFKATHLRDKTNNVQKYLEEHQDELCALRLIPLQSDLSKIRMRGLSTEDAMKWFEEQDIDEEKYRAEFIPHSDNPIWSTIFVVNENGIFGEIIRGPHDQLTQGFYRKDYTPISFVYDFNKLKLEQKNKKAKKHLEDVIDYLYIPDEETKEKLEDRLNSNFAQDYLTGYFETTSSEEFGLFFIDYNRVLGEIYNYYFFSKKNDESTDKHKQIKGKTGHPGLAQGKVKIVKPNELSKIELNEVEILVCKMTTPEYLPLMKQAKAIITDSGGLMSHATIVARELKTPCIVGTRNATKVLEDGDKVEVDSKSGVVKIIS